MISLIKGNSLERETDLGGHPLRCGAADHERNLNSDKRCAVTMKNYWNGIHAERIAQFDRPLGHMTTQTRYS